jgi:hypothetical protein
MMRLEEFLKKNQSAILDRWVQLVMDTYPADSAVLLDREKDRFLNPVGFTLREEAEALLKGLIEKAETEALSASLDRIIRIRSVQNFSPSQAVGFISLLKKAVTETLAKKAGEKPDIEGWVEFSDQIDALLFKAFDLYTQCREQIYDLRIKQEKMQSEMILKVLQRSNVSGKEIEKDKGVKS